MNKEDQKRHLIYQIGNAENFIARGGEFPDSDAHWGCDEVLKKLADRIKLGRETYFFSGHFICIGSVVSKSEIQPSRFLNTILLSDKKNVKFFRKSPSDNTEKERNIIKKYNRVPHPENEIHYRVASVGTSIAHVHRRPLFFLQPKRHYFVIPNPQDYIDYMTKLKDAIDSKNDLRYEMLNANMLESKIKDDYLDKYFVLVDKTTGEDRLSYTKYVLFDKFKESGWKVQIKNSELIIEK